MRNVVKTRYQFPISGMGGLSDAYSDCVNQVRAYPGEYVFKGAGITYSANAKASFTSTQTIFEGARGILASRGFYDIRFSGSVGTAFKSTIGVFLRSNQDRSSAEHVRGEIRNALISAGAQLVVDENMQVERPPAELICEVWKGGAGPGPPSGPGTPPPGAGPPGPADSLWDYLKTPIAGLGGLTAGVVIGGVLVLVMILKK